MFSAPVGGQNIVYINGIIILLLNLKQDVLSNVIIRPCLSNRGNYLKNRLIDAGLKDLICNTKKSFVDELKDCKLSISTENSTTFLETFSANYPTLLFWNPKFWEIRKEAKESYDKLYQNGILYYDAMSASSKLNEIYNDPINWWKQKNVQDTKNAFCNEFAYTSEDYIKIWKNELKQL